MSQLPKDLRTTYGTWAIVTHATSKLGLAYAEELLSRGMNVLLVDVDQVALTKAVTELKERAHGCQMESFVSQIRAKDWFGDGTTTKDCHRRNELCATIESRIARMTTDGGLGLVVVCRDDGETQHDPEDPGAFVSIDSFIKDTALCHMYFRNVGALITVTPEKVKRRHGVPVPEVPDPGPKRKRNNLSEPLPLKRHGSEVLLVKDPEIKSEVQLVHDRYGIDFLVVPQHLYAPKSLAQASLAVLGFSELFSRRHMIRFTLRNWLASIIPSFVRKQLSI